MLRSALPLLLVMLMVSMASGSAAQTGEKPNEEWIKCLTPYLIQYEEFRDRMDPEVSGKIDELLQSDFQNAEMIESPSGRFRIYFYRDGTNAVPSDDTNNSGIPDYVEMAAEYADDSWEKQVGELGFEDPATDAPLSIWIQNTGSDTYGYTVRDGETTRIVVHNTFHNFPPNDDPDGHQPGALKVTIAHELKHSIQFVTNRTFYFNTKSFDWIEMDATMMENIVYPQVNDYYNYIGGTSGIFGNPRRSTPVAYSHVTWSFFYAEYLGMPYWVDTWRVIRDDHHIQMVNAMREAFSSENRDKIFTELFARNHLWHAASGSRTIPGYGFSESAAYPDALMEPFPDSEDDSHMISEDYLDTGQLSSMSGTYRMITPGPGQIGQITLSVAYDQNNLAVGVLGYRRDGTAAEWIVPADAGGIAGSKITNRTSATSGKVSSTGIIEATSPFSASELDSFIVAIVNADHNYSVEYTLELNIESIPEEIVLDQNHPNPFSGMSIGASGNPGTTITFSVPESSRATVTVYDSVGRLVGKIFDNEVEPGWHYVPFDGTGLASGVYLYRLQVDDKHKMRKMTLIR